MRTITKKERSKKVAVWSAVAFSAVAFACLGWYGVTHIESPSEIEVITSNSFEQSSDSSQQATTGSYNQTGNDSTQEKKKESQKPASIENSGANEDFETMARPTIEQVNEAQKHLSEVSDQFVGKIEIPSIDLSLNILEGTTFQKMLYGATTLLPNQTIGKGNYALASHNMGVEGSMFTSIYKLKEGDSIYLTDSSGKTFHYQVTSNKVVDYQDTSCLNLTREPTVTLVTCQTVQDTPNRVIIQGKLQSN